MRIFQRFGLCFSTLKKEACGNVYIWSNNKPEKIALPEKAKRVSIGQNHTAIIGQSGNLYTYGENKYGQLGHANREAVKHPKLVEFFEGKSIKVQEAICGEHHTIVLGENGKVYTCGYGGKKANPFMRLFINYAGALGHGAQDSYSKPKLVRALEEQKIERITAGSKFNIVINDKGQVYHWGNGEFGVFGDGGNKDFSLPTKNEYFEYLEKEEQMTIKKVKSCLTYSIALMTDGCLYGWGTNHAGQMGIKNEIGIELHEMVNYPAPMIREGYEDQKVVNFDISENVTVFQLEDGSLWWSGKHIAYKPEPILLENQPQINLFAAGLKSFVAVSTSNQVYYHGSFLNVQGHEDLKTGVMKIDGSALFDGEILGIGGEYNARYAIVN